jgi:hypothetical protein
MINRLQVLGRARASNALRLVLYQKLTLRFWPKITRHPLRDSTPRMPSEITFDFTEACDTSVSRAPQAKRRNNAINLDSGNFAALS